MLFNTQLFIIYNILIIIILKYINIFDYYKNIIPEKCIMLISIILFELLIIKTVILKSKNSNRKLQVDLIVYQLMKIIISTIHRYTITLD